MTQLLYCCAVVILHFVAEQGEFIGHDKRTVFQLCHKVYKGYFVPFIFVIVTEPRCIGGTIAAFLHLTNFLGDL